LRGPLPVRSCIFCQIVNVDSVCFRIFVVPAQRVDPAKPGSCCLLIVAMACAVEFNFWTPKFNPWRGRCQVSEHAFTHRSVSELDFINVCCNLLICENSLLNCCNSGIRTEAYSHISDQLVGNFHCPCQEKLTWTLQNLGVGAPMSRVCKTFTRIASPRSFVWTPVIDLPQQSNRLLYHEFIHVSAELRLELIIIIFHASMSSASSPSIIYHSASLI